MKISPGSLMVALVLLLPTAVGQALAASDTHASTASAGGDAHAEAAPAGGATHTEAAPAALPAKVLARLTPTREKPNAPSLARTDAHRKLTPSDWEDPSICGGCHVVQYQGWKGSMHSNSFKDPIFQAEWALAEKQLGGKAQKLCAGCHTPVGMLTDTVKFDPSLGEHGGFTAPPIARNGVFCDVCHTISGTTFTHSEALEHGNGSYISSPGRIKRGPIKDAKSPYHETEYSEHHTQAAFCGNCHNIFNPLNNFPLERTYDEWKYSVYAQNDVQCQDCHMVPVETAMRVADELTPARRLEDHKLGGKVGVGAQSERDLVHGHAFVGGNAMVTAMLGDPDSRRHAAIAVQRLRNVAEVEVTLDRPIEGQPLHHARIKVTNKRAGHHIPTSLTFVRELWLDVQVTDENGNEIFRSGSLDDHGEVDPNATMFKAYAVDSTGKPAQFIWTVERFERRTTIPPRGHQFGDYYFNVPEDVKKLKVRARLQYRSFSQHFADHLLGDKAPEVPLIVMEDVESQYDAASLVLLQHTDHYAKEDPELAAQRLVEYYLGEEPEQEPIAQLARACAACHGEDGIGRTRDVPNIARQNELYLISALRSYRDATRVSERMNAMTADLSEEQIAQLARFYAGMPK